MKKNIRYTSLALGIFFLGQACKKSELTHYEQPDMVFIYKDGYNDARDSITYSFAVKPASLQTDTVRVPIRIMGNTADKDRTVKVSVIADSTTAVEGKDFELEPTVVPAGSFTSTINVVVKRNGELKEREVRLMLRIEESQDFLPGVPYAKASNATWGAGLSFFVRINDFYTKPADWDTRLVYYFGAFSQVKFGFIIGATGMTEFPTSGDNQLPYGMFTYLGTLCKNSLAEYTSLNGPLFDESGNLVTFP